MANKIDFYMYGVEFANATLEEIATKAKEIKEKYGNGAKLDFEVGFASTISEYAYVEDEEEIINLEHLGGTLDFGDLNLRNNSYFNGTGVSKKFITGPEGTVKYNVPKTR